MISAQARLYVREYEGHQHNARFPPTELVTEVKLYKSEIQRMQDYTLVDVKEFLRPMFEDFHTQAALHLLARIQR